MKEKYSLVFICLILIFCLSCTNQDNVEEIIEFYPEQVLFKTGYPGGYSDWQC